MPNSLSNTWLVTGACGFIGTNLVRRLCDEGDRVRILDNFSIIDAVPDERVEVIRGDILDREVVRSAVEGCNTVVHLAGQSGVMPSLEDPIGDFESNATGTLNLLLACRDAGVHRFVHASSSAALGQVDLPFEESKAPRPLSPYGASKLAGEAYCLAFSGSFGLHTASLRFANAYGPFSAHKNSAVAKFIKETLDGNPINVFGDGSQTRDFVYVEDLCDAIVLAANSDCPSEVFHIATGVETSVSELITILRNIFEAEAVTVIYHDRREGEAYRIRVSIEKARTMLGFSPKVDFAEGVKRTYEWFLANYKGSQANPLAQQSK